MCADFSEIYLVIFMMKWYLWSSVKKSNS